LPWVRATAPGTGVQPKRARSKLHGLLTPTSNPAGTRAG
jgi:hypothetical protein